MPVFHTSGRGAGEESDILAARYEETRLICVRIARHMLKGESLAEDALHDAFAAVIAHREKYLALPLGEFTKLIAVIVKSKCIDILRKNGREALIFTDEIDELPAGESANTEAIALGESDFGRMDEFLDMLDDLSRQILLMKYVQELSYKEIAAALGMKEKTVEVRIARAKKKIREQARINSADTSAKGK